MNGSIKKPLVIKAPWILGTGGRWVENASLVWDPVKNVVIGVERSKITAGGFQINEPDKEITGVVDVGDRAIIPGLVNAHTHLELSALSGLFREIPRGDYIGWVRKVISEKNSLSRHKIQTAFADAAFDCVKSGVSIVADVSNNPFLELALDSNRRPLPRRYLLWEWIGFDVEDADFPEEDYILREGVWADRVSIVSHALYSTSPFLIRETKNWCRKRNRIFSIHVGESEEEHLFIREGKGIWREFLEEIGKWNKNWEPPRTTPIEYLDGLKVLDDQTLLVHCLHLTEGDWDIVQERRCYVCLCPRSNHELGTGKIAAREIIRRKVPFLIGTDSLASSPGLNLFEEAVFLIERYSDFDPQDVLKAITGEGHRFFRKIDSFIEPGFRGRMLAVEISGLSSGKELAMEILYNGIKGAYTWIPPF